MVRIGCSWLGGPWLGYHPAIRKLISALGLIALALFAACSPPSPPLTSKGVVRLPRDPKPPTAIDLLSLDPRNHLLYVAHSSSNSLDMIDTRTMKVVGSVAGLLNVKATTPTSDPNIIFSSNGNDGTLSVIDVPARKVLEKIKIGGNPDAISYDPSHDVVAVGVTAEKKLKLVDVRTKPELLYVGAIPGAVTIEWQTYPGSRPNPEFLGELAALAKKDEPVMFICRSGARSHGAAEAALRAGWRETYNVLEGFEGDKDAASHRNSVGGWRKAGLPWTQS